MTNGFQREAGILTIMPLCTFDRFMQLKFAIAFVLSAVLVMIVISAQAQELPKVIPPSPQSAELMRYIDFPMDLSSGLPTVSIPLYTIKSQELVLPISLSYHGDGLRPNEAESGIIGLGWSLNAGGVISRTISIGADEVFWNTMIPNASDIQTEGTIHNDDSMAGVLAGTASGETDTEPDIFSYSLPADASGKFVFARSTSLSEFLTPVLLPYRAVKVTPHLVDATPNVDYFDYFDVLSDEGVQYRFGKSLKTGIDVHEKYFNISSATVIGSGISSWLLTEMVSADKSDTLFFEYDRILKNTSGQLGSDRLLKTDVSFTSSFTNHGHNPNHPEEGDDSFASSVNYSGYEYTQTRISKIKFKHGYVNFVYGSLVYPNHQLIKIEVYASNSTTPLQVIEFSRSKYHTDPAKCNWDKLNELTFRGQDNASVYRYMFDYETGVFPTLNNSLYSNLTYSIDFWGYYNGAVNINTLPSFTWTGIPSDPNNLFGSANRSPNSIYSRVGMLKKIVYPTGGEMTFDYEGNKNSQGNDVGGIRLAASSLSDGNKSIKRSYLYEGVSRPVIEEHFKRISLAADGTAATWDLWDTYEAHSEPVMSPGLLIEGKPVVYSKVSEHLVNGSEDNGRIEHYFNNWYSDLIYDLWNIPLLYPWSSGGRNITPISRYFSNQKFADALETQTSVFNSAGDLLKTTLNYYSTSATRTMKGFSALKAVTILIPPDPVPTISHKVSNYYFNNYDIYQYTQRLDSTVTTEYSGSLELLVKEKYAYNNYLHVIEKKNLNSDGSWGISRLKYPLDFVATSPYTSMVNDRNMLSPVVETQVLKASSENAVPQLLRSEKTNYFDFGGNVIKPLSIQTAQKTDPYRTEVEFLSYDQDGNVLSLRKANGPTISYLWSYNKCFPIAEVVNANPDQIAFTSFENSNYEGGWNFINYYSTTEAQSGRRCFMDVAVNQGISKSNLPQGNYVVSLWAKMQNTGIPYLKINQTSTLVNSNVWKYYEFTVTGGTPLLVDSDHVLIDDLRIYPSGAQMTTFTYDLLRGVTSQADVNNQHTHFEYDNFGQLQVIKDDKKNIVKSYLYNYLSK